MPIIHTSKGDVSYKNQIIYWGVKTINKEIAQNNLFELKNILDASQINFLLIAGTLLGAIREHDFIDHDEDIDLAFLDEDRAKVLDVIPQLLLSGFEIARYDDRGLLSVIRDGEYIDLYFFKEKEGEKGIRTCCGWLVLEKFLVNTTHIDFKGNLFAAPNDYVEYLKCEYGDNWMVPVKWFDYKMPWWKKRIFALKEHMKNSLPSCLMKVIQKKRESQFEMQYRKSIEKYLSNGGSIV